MVKAGGRTLLSSQSRACTLILHPQTLRKTFLERLERWHERAILAASVAEVIEEPS